MINCRLARLDRPVRLSLVRLCPFQLGILLDQLLQTEARELYRNLGLFTFSFSMINRAFAIFGMAHLLPWLETLLAPGLLHQRFRDAEFLSPRGEKLGNVVDRIVTASGIGGGRSPRLVAGGPVGAALILVLVGIMRWFGWFVGRGHSCPGRLPFPPRSPQFVH